MKVFHPLILALCLSFSSISQNETKQWWFNTTVGLDFNSNPPNLFPCATITMQTGCSSIADVSGNLLFYTNGITVYNKNHATMANGNGLLGGNQTSQSALIVKKPASNYLYYIFTNDGPFNPNNGLRYSIVDMSLAAGMGSVTVKNILLFLPPYSSEKLTGTKHCNGSDVWIITHDCHDKFLSYQLSSLGVNTTAVISTVGDTTMRVNGSLKVSPNGKKLAMAIPVNQSNLARIELYDFDNATGIVSSNSLILPGIPYVYGCEFSPDGSKLYGACMGGSRGVYQWDLCAGSASAIIASRYAAPTNSLELKGHLQLAANGKIYCGKGGTQTFLGVINNPNAPGALCNYVDYGQSIAPGTPKFTLPNFVTSSLRMPVPPYTFTTNCQNVNFTGLSGTSTLLANCAAASYSPTSSTWDFGDAASGTASTSNQADPVHFYSAPGTYTTVLVLHYNCFNDTIRQVINITAASPTFAVSGPTAICKGESATLNANAVYNYSWSTSSTNASVIVTPTNTAQYTVTATSSVTGCTWSKIVGVTVKPCMSLNNNDLISFSYYPNPTTGNLFIETEKNVEISVFNSIGQLVINKCITVSKTELSFAQFQAGLYFMRVDDGQVSRVVRVIREE
jgi:hypothetical protein